MTHFPSLSNLKIENYSNGVYTTHELYHMVSKLNPDTNLQDWTIIVSDNIPKEIMSNNAAGTTNPYSKIIVINIINARKTGRLTKRSRNGYLPKILKTPSQAFEFTLAHELFHVKQFNRAKHTIYTKGTKVARLMEAGADRYAMKMTNAYFTDYTPQWTKITKKFGFGLRILRRSDFPSDCV